MKVDAGVGESPPNKGAEPKWTGQYEVVEGVSQAVQVKEKLEPICPTEHIVHMFNHPAAL